MSARVGYGQRRVFVTPEFIEAWLVQEMQVKADLPEDARFVRMWPHDMGHAYTLVFESEEWDELEEGEKIPRLMPEVEGLDE